MTPGFAMKKLWIVCSLLFLVPTSGMTATPQPVSAKHAMVVTESRIASQAGIDILKAGGNAIDAAVAVGYTLAVVNSCCGNIGGGGFMTIHLANGKNTVINFRGKAPLNINKNLFLDANGNIRPNATTSGYLSVAIPGTVMGLDYALKKYGKLTRKQVMAPAIQLAQEGYAVTAYEAKLFATYSALFSAQANVSAIFLKDGHSYRAGDILKQQDLANTLRLISEYGSDVFYKGSIAKKIVAASEANGGVMTLKDFSQYSIKETAPIQCQHQGYTILSAAPPSSGGITLCEMLGILQNIPLKNMGYQTAESIRDIVESMRYGFYDRNTKLGDPDFINNPVAELLSPAYTSKLSKKILEKSTVEHNQVEVDVHEQTDTTHYSIVDSKGNAVSVTYTLNGFFGAGVIAGDTGFFLNDDADDFTIVAGKSNKFNLMQSATNEIKPGKRPLSSMSPTIVMKNNHVYMVVGSPGGPRIITAVLLTLLNVIDYGMNIQQAIDMPRYHFQGVPDFIDMEPMAFSIFTSRDLENMGYHLRPQNKWAAVEAILVNPATKTLYGANDDRRPDGAAVGY